MLPSIFFGLHINFSKSELHFTETFVFWDCIGIQWICLSLLPSEKLLEIQQLAHDLLQRKSVKVYWVMSFLGKTTFCASGHTQFYQLCHVIQSDMLIVYHLKDHFFLSFHLSLPALHQFWGLSH